MEVLVDAASWVLLLAGSGFSIAAGIGILRFPDFYSRLHAAGVSDTMGAWLILIGLILQAGLTHTAIKLVLIVVFLFFTSPTATHALARAALAANLRPWTRPLGAAPTSGVSADAPGDERNGA